MLYLGMYSALPNKHNGTLIIFCKIGNGGTVINSERLVSRYGSTARMTGYRVADRALLTSPREGLVPGCWAHNCP